MNLTNLIMVLIFGYLIFRNLEKYIIDIWKEKPNKEKERLISFFKNFSRPKELMKFTIELLVIALAIFLIIYSTFDHSFDAGWESGFNYGLDQRHQIDSIEYDSSVINEPTWVPITDEYPSTKECTEDMGDEEYLSCYCDKYPLTCIEGMIQGIRSLRENKTIQEDQ